MKKNTLTFFCLLLSVLVFAQVNPYSSAKKKYPLGDEFEKILPVNIGNWSRFAFHDFVPNRENGSVYYKFGEKQVYITFGKAYSQNSLNTIWSKIYDDATDGKLAQLKAKNTSSNSSKYVLLNGKSGLFYAWTRNLYYFSITTKDKVVADEFMKLFPY